MRIHLDHLRRISILLDDYPEKQINNTLSHHGFHKIPYEDIDNPHQLPKINLDKLYEREGEVWMFLGFDSGLEDDGEMVYMADFQRIGYIIKE